MRALLSLLVLCATSALADVSQARKDEVAKAPVVIVRGSADAMESVLGRAKANFVIVDPSELAELPLHSKQVVMVNCTGVMPDAALARLKRFVTAGGFLYTTDHAVFNVVQKLFPNTIAWTGGSTVQEVVPVRIHGSNEDRGLLNSLGGNAKELWQTAGGGFPVKVLDPKRVTVLMDSEVAEKKYGSGIVAVRFRWEDGQVIHVTGHFSTQPGQTQEQVAQSGGRVFEQLSQNVVEAKAADEGRINDLYGSSTKRSINLQASPSPAAPPWRPARLEGEDGVQTCAIEGRGVAFRLSATRLPWAPSVTSWSRALVASAARRWSPDVTVTRNFVGHYRVELPLLPFELARRIENVTADQSHAVERFSVVAGDEARIDVDERGWPIVMLDEAAQRELVQQLDALQEPELTWLSVTLVFKPLV